MHFWYQARDHVTDHSESHYTSFYKIK